MASSMTSGGTQTHEETKTEVVAASSEVSILLLRVVLYIHTQCENAFFET